MCMSASGIPPEDLQKFRECVASMGESTLQDFLATLVKALDDGITVCMGLAVSPEDEPPTPPQAPGIYPV